MKLIGISGTNGSGKDSLGKLLSEKYGWLFVPVTEILRTELRKRGEPVERERLRKLGNDWRREFGNAFLMDKAVEIFEKEAGKYNGLAIASIRNLGEADRIHELKGIIVWLDADPQIRYKRVSERFRSPEDQKSFEQFMKEEEQEMRSDGDASGLSMAGVKTKADLFITNDTSAIEDFNRVAEKALEKYL